MRLTLDQLAATDPKFESASHAASAFFTDVLTTWTRALQPVAEADQTYSSF
jgi:hypothetical protein